MNPTACYTSFMEKPSAFLRQQAKERPGAPEERARVAAEIRSARHESREHREQIAELTEWIEASHSERARELERSLQETAAAIEIARTQLDELSKSWFSRVWHHGEQQRLRQEIQGLFETEAGLEGQRQQLSREREEKSAALSELTSAQEQAAKPQDMMTDYYQQERARWQNIDVDWEAVDTNFTAEHLSTLDLESYVDLLRRFPSEMVTHVSRRGVRDHFDRFHQGGLFEYHNGFDQVLESKRLKSGIGVKLDQANADAYIAKEIGLDGTQTAEEAHAKIDEVSGETGWNSFADHSAVHFAAEQVADSAYGTERGNEVFIVFPSALIAAEYQFGGYHGQGLTEASEDSDRNDLWVWGKEQEGVPIDAGIVFLPADARVDARTGSRYALSEEYQPMPDTTLMAAVDTAIDSEAFQGALDWLRTEENRIRDLPWEQRKNEQDALDARYRAYLKEHISPDERLTDVLAEKGQFLFSARQNRPDEYPHERNETMQGLGHSLAEAQETIPSQTYWERYFQDHPDRKPSKVVFYTGDPSEALRAWKEQNGLTKKSADTPGLRYDDRRVDSTDASPTKSRFQSLAREVVDRHFDTFEQWDNSSRITVEQPHREHIRLGELSPGVVKVLQLYKRWRSEERPPEEAGLDRRILAAIDLMHALDWAGNMLQVPNVDRRHYMAAVRRMVALEKGDNPTEAHELKQITDELHAMDDAIEEAMGLSGQQRDTYIAREDFDDEMADYTSERRAFRAEQLAALTREYDEQLTHGNRTPSETEQRMMQAIGEGLPPHDTLAPLNKEFTSHRDTKPEHPDQPLLAYERQAVQTERDVISPDFSSCAAIVLYPVEEDGTPRQETVFAHLPPKTYAGGTDADFPYTTEELQQLLPADVRGYHAQIVSGINVSPDDLARAIADLGVAVDSVRQIPMDMYTLMVDARTKQMVARGKMERPRDTLSLVLEGQGSYRTRDGGVSMVIDAQDSTIFIDTKVGVKRTNTAKQAT